MGNDVVSYAPLPMLGCANSLVIIMGKGGWGLRRGKTSCQLSCPSTLFRRRLVAGRRIGCQTLLTHLGFLRAANKRSMWACSWKKQSVVVLFSFPMGRRGTSRTQKRWYYNYKPFFPQFSNPSKSFGAGGGGCWICGR